MNSEQTAAVMTGLRAEARGRVWLPGDPDWDAARSAWNRTVDQQPAAVAEAADAADVAAVMRHAADTGLGVVAQSTGHGADTLPPLDGTLLLRTSRLRQVTVDAAARTARVGAGGLAGEIAAAADTHRLAPVLGLAPTVGIVGLTLGGGTGWLSRAHGLCSDSVRGYEIVTPDGTTRHVNATSEPDLFWALHGGGGPPGVVTALELDLHPAPVVNGGMLVWPAERAGEVLDRFRTLADRLPEHAGAVLRYISMPDVDGPPPPLRGRRVVAVVVAHLGPEHEATALLESLRTMGGTLLDSFGPISPAALVRIAGDPEQPSPARGEGFLVDEAPDALFATLAALIEGDALAPLVTLELRLLGGALARPSERRGALAAITAPYSVFAGGAVHDERMRGPIDARLVEFRERLAPWRSPVAILNAVAPGTDEARGFDPQTWERLQRIRARYDPDGVMRG